VGADGWAKRLPNNSLAEVSKMRRKKERQEKCPNCGGVRLTATKCGICGKEVCPSCMYIRYFHWNSQPAIRCERCAGEGFKKFTD
jgi:hypothetical protein